MLVPGSVLMKVPLYSKEQPFYKETIKMFNSLRYCEVIKVVSSLVGGSFLCYIASG